MEKNRVFRFKQFAVDDSCCAMKVGTDGVLLGAWAPVDGVRRVLDVGTGCGVIALMVAQRAPQALIDAIDIDAQAAQQAMANFASSPWGERLSARQCDFNELAATMSSTYDLVVCNPPFFADGVMPPDDRRSLARHGTSLTLEQLLNGAERLLTPQGRLAMVTPVEARPLVMEYCAYHDLRVNGLTEVVPVEGRAPKRLLWLCSRMSTPLRANVLVMTAQGSFTQPYVDLVRDFYLKM